MAVAASAAAASSSGESSSSEMLTQLSSCVELVRSLSHRRLRSSAVAIRSAANKLIRAMEAATATECALMMRDHRTRELLPLIDREQAEQIVARRWRALLDEPDEQEQRTLVQQVSQEEVQQVVDALVKSKDESQVSRDAGMRQLGELVRKSPRSLMSVITTPCTLLCSFSRPSSG